MPDRHADATSAAPSAYLGGELALFRRAVRWKRYLRQQLLPYLSGRVLEVGAGLGGTTAHLLDPGSQASWTCLEPDPVLAGELEAGIGRLRTPMPVETTVGTLKDVDVSRAFDAVIYVDVLEHIDDDRTELASAAAHLAPGGTLVVLSPACPWLFTPFDAQVGHVRRYTADTLAAAGPPCVPLERVWYLDAAGLLASLANKLLLAQSMPTERQILVWDRWLVPASRVLDPLLGHAVGRSIAAVWRRPRD